MPVNKNYYLIFDFETVGVIQKKNGVLDGEAVQPAQVACLAVDPVTLEVVPGSQFCSLMRPTISPSDYSPGALRVNKLDPDAIAAAPDRGQVWKRFTDHVARYRIAGGPRGYPIAAGKNIRNFDLPIVQYLCGQYGPADKAGSQAVFNDRVQLDLEDPLFLWFEGQPAASGGLSDYKMDTVRTYFGMPADGAHSADVDVFQTAQLITRFLKLHRAYFPRTKFRGALAGST